MQQQKKRVVSAVANNYAHNSVDVGTPLPLGHSQKNRLQLASAGRFRSNQPQSGHNTQAHT